MCERCFARLTPGQLLDTTMDKQADSIAVDSTGDGKVDINDLMGVYNGKKHPDVIAGRKTEEQVFLQLLIL